MNLILPSSLKSQLYYCNPSQLHQTLQLQRTLPSDSRYAQSKQLKQHPKLEYFGFTPKLNISYPSKSFQSSYLPPANRLCVWRNHIGVATLNG